MMKNSKNNTNRARRPIAYWGFWIAIVILIFSAIAFLGSNVPKFPWLSLIKICAGFAILVAIWLWGFYTGLRQKHAAIQTNKSDAETKGKQETPSPKGDIFVQDPDWRDLPEE